MLVLMCSTLWYDINPLLFLAKSVCVSCFGFLAVVFVSALPEQNIHFSFVSVVVIICLSNAHCISSYSTKITHSATPSPSL